MQNILVFSVITPFRYRLSAHLRADDDAPGVEYIGSLTVDCSSSDTRTSAKSREIAVAVYFGRSEIEATAEFVMTKAKATTKLTYGRGEQTG